MDTIKTLRENEELADILDNICDIQILPELEAPDDYDGVLSFNIQGKVFGKDASGGEYIILDDGSVAFSGSEGETGRMADSLNDFFLLMVNCPFWQDYVQENAYKSRKTLSKFAKKLFEEHAKMEEEDMETDLRQAQKDLSEGLNIPIYDDVLDILLKFYGSAHCEPEFISTYKESDGSLTYSSGSLFM